jgi:Xaa-Pro aminopeptidase
MTSIAPEILQEIETKIQRVHALLHERRLDALWLRRTSSFAWATCGADAHINTASSDGIASLLVTLRDRYLVTNNIEIHRLEQEGHLAGQGWQLLVSPWFDPGDQFTKITAGLKVGSDLASSQMLDLSSETAWLRAQLTPAEGERFRKLGGLCAEAMLQAVQALKPGMTEYQVSGLLAAAFESRGVQLIVNLVACDERVLAFRHPLPTDKALKRYAMLVVCGRKWGLVCSLTRLVYFGSFPAALRAKIEATARIDAVLISATRPGARLSEIFEQAQGAYAEAGFPNEWHLHHQGGLAGYEPRELTVTPAALEAVLSGQAFAWNPSISGAKSEDTILVGDQGNEILTQIQGWPVVDVAIGDQTIQRPAVLEM